MGNKTDRINCEGYELKENIVKNFSKYGAKIDVVDWQFQKGRYVFEIKLKGKTREAQVRKYSPDVQLNLKLPLFQVVKENYTLLLVASMERIKYDPLPDILGGKIYQKASKQMWLPYVVGYDALGDLFIIDIADLPHLLLGGSTNSGKSVGMQALIVSITYDRSSAEVNFILIDVGANNLRPFEGLPHLACPIVSDRTTAIHALTALTDEMERRIELERTDPIKYDRLPRLVLAIDEFPALFTGLEKAKAKAMADMLSSLLQRGRHAKIHLVLAAQNPTFQNMKIDLSNITARIAFQCAKKNFSETILGESGAEELLGYGDMLMKIPGRSEPYRVQGIYIRPQEVEKIVQDIKEEPFYSGGSGQKFTIEDNDFSTAVPDNNCGITSSLPCSPIATKPYSEEHLLATALLWTIGKDAISIHQIQHEYHLGWDKATRLVKRLEDMGIVEPPMSKLPRRVIPITFGDIPDDMLAFLQRNGVTREDIDHTLAARNKNPPGREGYSVPADIAESDSHKTT